MADNSISNQVYLSRDQIRNQLIEYAKTYLELENIDLTKSSFLSYIINTFATLTSNLLFYQLSNYREFFLTQAQLPESILNLASFIGYTSQDASYSSVNVLMTMPFGFEDAISTFTISEGMEFKTPDNIPFATYYDVTITITNDSSVEIVVVDGTKTYNIPVSIDTVNDEFSFLLPVRQYSVTINEFQVDEDTPQLQFVTIDVPIAGKVAELAVRVRDPDSSAWTTYTEFASLFLMSETDYGYVERRIETGKRLYFGNGLIGVQPTPGSTVEVTVQETLGADGNVISGTINSGDRIYYTTDSGVTKVVNYTITNTSAATGGEDEESLEEIRRNSIANLVALNRLVSEDDFTNVDAIIEDAPVASNSIPILKRSDVKINEISLFSTILFSNGIVPSRNVKYTVPITTTRIDRDTIITDSGTDYITIFDIYPDYINQSATYEYIMYKIEQIPTLVTSYGSTYDFTSDLVVVSRSGTAADFRLKYHSTESNSDLATCQMEISQTGIKYDMTNDSTASEFVLILDPYELLPEDEVTYNFLIKNPSAQLIAQYSTSLVFRQTLDDFMLSNAFIDGTSITVYDIPVVKESYYESITKEDFELQILQTFLTAMEFSSYKMTTDFINMKFTNTTGTLTSMQYNKYTRDPVISISQTSVPISPSLADRYIINGQEGGDWLNKEDLIAQCSDATNVTWFYTQPIADDIVLIQDVNLKYIYTDTGWRIATYQIPLTVELHVTKESSYSGSAVELSNLVKSTLISAFSSRFGANTALYRSEIISVVQEIVGVHHCRLVKPESNIFFNFDLIDLTEQQLLEYGPEYVYFDTDSITIRIK